MPADRNIYSLLLATYEFVPLDANFAWFCFILLLQILDNLLAKRPRPRAAVGGSRGGEAPLGWTMTTFEISKKSQAFLLCWQWTYSATM